MAGTPARTDGPLGCLDKSVASFDEIPAESPRRNQSRIAQMDGFLVNTIAYSSESTYAANLEMATPEYKPSQPLEEEIETPMETPGVKSIDEVAAFLNVPEEATIKTLVYHRW